MKTVLLVRHADIDHTDGALPTEPLNDKGRLRAETLARLAEGLRVTAIFTSKVVRTESTAQPLAGKLGIHTQPMPAPAHLAETIASGTVVLVVGHSDTVPRTIKALHGPQLPNIAHEEFDNLFVVTVDETGKAGMVQLKYGNPTP